MSTVADARVWCQTAHGEISVVRPVAGLELLSLRAWNRPWSGSVAGLGLVVAEAPEALEARVAGLFQTLSRGSVLFIPANEHYSLRGRGSLTASIVSFEAGWVEQAAWALGPRATRRAWVATAPELDAALRHLIARIETEGPGSYAAERAQILLELSAIQSLEMLPSQTADGGGSEPPPST